MALSLDRCKDYPHEMFVSDLPSDIALVENFPESNKDSDRLKPPEVPVPSLPAPNPEAEVLRPMKQTCCGRSVNSSQTTFELVDCCK
ncbi:hypothetical protein TNIN_286511 [Trichonephila inaurata madagascariensis]|uniref:Uncharacterized protein n=1 Tax=Trichonephila inaurata madagascariensis TaxID=2747483 RepID=A0A8X7CC64_9ARAC|nr:hypothetical protein TNIN_286511 [Trichonephila inaurata madagascariensis]